VTPPAILLDRSFLHALSEATHASHVQAEQRFRELVVGVVKGQHRLVALSTDLVQYAERRHGLFAAVDTLHVAAQHRHAANEASASLPPDLRQAAVMVHRERIRRVVSCDPAWQHFDVDAEVLESVEG
jgi:hypothetical protein